MAHDDLQQLQDEYRQIQGWLHGEKPPAAGRTWRRRLYETAAPLLPQVVRTSIDNGQISALAVPLLRVGIGMICMGYATEVLPALAGPVAGADLPLDAMMALARIVGRYTTWLGVVASTSSAVIWCMRGA